MPKIKLVQPGNQSTLGGLLIDVDENAENDPNPQNLLSVSNKSRKSVKYVTDSGKIDEKEELGFEQAGEDSDDNEKIDVTPVDSIRAQRMELSQNGTQEDPVNQRKKGLDLPIKAEDSVVYDGSAAIGSLIIEEDQLSPLNSHSRSNVGKSNDAYHHNASQEVQIGSFLRASASQITSEPQKEEGSEKNQTDKSQ